LVAVVAYAVITAFLLLPPVLAQDTAGADIVRLPPLIFRPGYCGDGNCDEAEACNDCPADCGPCKPEQIGLGMSVLTLLPLLLLILFILFKRRKTGREKNRRNGHFWDFLRKFRTSSTRFV